MYLTFDYSDFSADEGIMNIAVIGLLTMCWTRNDLKTTVHILPTFKPTEYMYKTFANKGVERWQVYGWALRDALSKQSGMPTSELPQRAKQAYKQYMKGNLNIPDFDSKSVD